MGENETSDGGRKGEKCVKRGGRNGGEEVCVCVCVCMIDNHK